MALGRKTVVDVAGIALAFALLTTGCTPKIGDDCGTSVDCSALGDRLCDTTQPGGYCTLFNCEPNECPDEAVCIAFNGQLDPACGDLDDGQFGRFGRTFCMKQCDDSSDCRDGYECVRAVDRDARVLDTNSDNPQENKVCLALSSAPSSSGPPPNACLPNDGVGGLSPYDPGTGGAGQGGAGQGGAGQGGAGQGGAGQGGAGGSSQGGAGGSQGGAGGMSAGGAGGA